MSEVAARVVAEAESSHWMSPSMREDITGGISVRRPWIPSNKAERHEMLKKFLHEWNGPDSAKSRILEAHATDDFVLYLNHENLKNLPDGLYLLTHMGYLNIEKNSALQQLPDDLAFAPNLARLNANGCDLHALPSNLSEARNLVILEAADNRNLTSLPESMDRLDALQTVDLKNCDLSRLPEGGLGPALRELNLCGNRRLSHLPTEIGSSKQLELLLVRDCSLRQIPSQLGKLPRLRSLDVSGNTQIETLPPGINLKKVFIGTRDTRIRLMDVVLNQPIDSQVRKENGKKLKALQKKWQSLGKEIAEGGAGVEARVDAARREVERQRSGLSSTVQSTSTAGMNWKTAADQVKGWAEQGHPVDTEHLKKLNALLGRGLHPFNDPQAFDKYAAQFGEFRKQSTGFPMGESWYAVVDEREVGAEMAHFDEWFEARSEEVAQGTLNPVELAAATAQRLVSIHPFADANGRTARLAGDWVLASHGLPPAAFENIPKAVYSSGRNREGPEDALVQMTQAIAKTIEIYERYLHS
ncbi:XopAC/AvrAC family type III secretion system effector [Paracidovorax cattleyae]|nr:XopAC/AvrAC family type III secretion system effector [Paracidovorax cattleyae]